MDREELLQQKNPGDDSSSLVGTTTTAPAVDNTTSSVSTAPDHDTTSSITAAATRNRVTAKQQVLQAWNERRRHLTPRQVVVERNQPEPFLLLLDTHHQHHGLIASTPPPPQPPSMCFLLKKAWKDIFVRHAAARHARTYYHNDAHKKKPQHNGGRETMTTTTTTTPPVKQPKQQHADAFPSVLSILQAHELVRQVESMAAATTATTATTTTAQQQQQYYQTTANYTVSFLPTGYDWNRAISEMARARGRAFLLVDLAAVVRQLWAWKRTHYYQHHAPPQKDNDAHDDQQTPKDRLLFLYSVQANTKLVPVVSHVLGLVTTTKWDVQHLSSTGGGSSATAATAATANSARLYDNAAVTGKPDGYLREWIQLVLRQDGSSSNSSNNVVVVAVDGPDEVERTQKSVQRIWARRRQHGADQAAVIVVNYILRLGGDDDCNTWEALVQATAQRLQQQQQQVTTTSTTGPGKIVGISVDFSGVVLSERQRSVHDLLDKMAAMADNPNSSTVEQQRRAVVAPRLRIDVTGVDNPSDPQLLEWWNYLLEERSDVAQVTVDATKALVSPTGALCTRITGVRRTFASSHDDQIPPSPHYHYYIDDGCYGSLYQQSNDLCPLPLFSNDQRQDDDDGGDDNATSTTTFVSTVWGPTCDGLDRVCQDIVLPRLRRDDWLVFPNVGCGHNEGLGTAFNGFDPPDTAYCVLGIFDNVIDKNGYYV